MLDHYGFQSLAIAAGLARLQGAQRAIDATAQTNNMTKEEAAAAAPVIESRQVRRQLERLAAKGRRA